MNAEPVLQESGDRESILLGKGHQLDDLPIGATVSGVQKLHEVTRLT